MQLSIKNNSSKSHSTTSCMKEVRILFLRTPYRSFTVKNYVDIRNIVTEATSNMKVFAMNIACYGSTEHHKLCPWEHTMMTKPNSLPTPMENRS